MSWIASSIGKLDALLVKVRLHTILQRQTAAGIQRELELDLPDDSPVDYVLDLLRLEVDPAELIIAVNGRMVEEGQRLSAGDVVDLIPAISGG